MVSDGIFPGVMLAVAVVLLAASGVVLVQSGRRFARWQGRIQGAILRSESEAAELRESLREFQSRTPEPGEHAADPGAADWEAVAREGRLHGSTRTQALRLLRTGFSPESAAARLGMPVRDARLLEQIRQVLWANTRP